MKYILFPEGKIIKDTINNSYKYEYFLKDHLGNTRITFNEAGQVLEKTAYYPFGMPLEGLYSNSVAQDDKNKYLYNGKELQDEMNLDCYDYGARNYDAVVGRWWNVDPMAEKYYRWSPYNYCANNPMIFIDPTGMSLVIELPVAATEGHDSKAVVDALTGKNPNGESTSKTNMRVEQTFEGTEDGKGIDTYKGTVHSTVVDKSGDEPKIGVTETTFSASINEKGKITISSMVPKSLGEAKPVDHKLLIQGFLKDQATQKAQNNGKSTIMQAVQENKTLQKNVDDIGAYATYTGGAVYLLGYKLSNPYLKAAGEITTVVSVVTTFVSRNLISTTANDIKKSYFIEYNITR